MSEDSTAEAASDALEPGKLTSNENDRAELYAPLEG